MEQVTAIGLDFPKTVFQVHGVDAIGTVLVREQLRRSDVLRFPPRIGKAKLYRLEAAPPRVREIAWKEQTRLTARYRALSGRRRRSSHGDRSRARRLHVVGGKGGPDRLNAGSPHRARVGAGPRQGNSRQTLCGRLHADARRKIGTAPDALSGMR